MNTFYRHVEYLAQLLRNQGYSVSVTMDDNDENPASVLISGADITIHTMSAERFLEVAHLYGGSTYQGLPIYYHPNSFNFVKHDQFRALLGNTFNWYVASGYYSHERSLSMMNHDAVDAEMTDDWLRMRRKGTSWSALVAADARALDWADNIVSHRSYHIAYTNAAGRVVYCLGTSGLTRAEANTMLGDRVENGQAFPNEFIRPDRYLTTDEKAFAEREQLGRNH